MNMNLLNNSSNNINTNMNNNNNNNNNIIIINEDILALSPATKQRRYWIGMNLSTILVQLLHYWETYDILRTLFEDGKQYKDIYSLYLFFPTSNIPSYHPFLLSTFMSIATIVEQFFQKGYLPCLYTKMAPDNGKNNPPNSTHPYNLLLQLVNQGTFLNDAKFIFGPEYDSFIKNTVENYEQRNEIRINFLSGIQTAKDFLVNKMKETAKPIAGNILMGISRRDVRKSLSESEEKSSPGGSNGNNNGVFGIESIVHNEVKFYLWNVAPECKHH